MDVDTPWETQAEVEETHSQHRRKADLVRRRKTKIGVSGKEGGQR